MSNLYRNVDPDTVKFIHDGNNPGFFFDYTFERFQHFEEEGCAPHLVTPEQAQKIWVALGYTGTFEIYEGMGFGYRVYSRDYEGAKD